MEGFLLGFVFFVITSVPVAVIIVLSNWIPRKYGRKKLARILPRILVIGYLLSILSIVFEDLIFFKYNVNNLLENHKIELLDDYQIISNRNSGIRDYTHEFKLLISEKDKIRIINQIKSSKNFISNYKNDFYLPNTIGRYSETKVFANYENERSFIRESFETYKKGYKPCYEIVTIFKDENKLIFEQISD
jgi:hypothetical protein